MLTKKITKEELLVIAAARQIKNGDVTILGIGLPILAGAVAKATHAPRAVLMMESGIVDFEPRVLPTNVADATCTRGYGYAIDLFSVFTTIAYAGYLDKAFLGVGQVDRYGNLNTSFLGETPLRAADYRRRGCPGIHRLCEGDDPVDERKGVRREAPLPDKPGLSRRRERTAEVRALHTRFGPEHSPDTEEYFQV